MITGRRRRNDEQGPTPYADQVAELARAALSPAVHAYVAQGSAGSVTASEAAAAWRRCRLWPRVLQDVTTVDLTTRFLEAQHTVPFGIAPTTLQRAAHPDGEVEMARAAADLDVPLVVSSNAGSSFADIGATGARWWLQMYVTADRSVTAPVVSAALDAGAGAIVLTADTPVVARKPTTVASVRDVVEPGWLRANFPGGDSEVTADKAADLGPQDIAWLGERFGVPVVVKGVLRPDDARRCVEAGASAVWVSNHGGRQLDRAVSTCTALPAVRAALSESPAQVFVDGGVASGLDALVALALGADGVFLGRLPFFALAHDGAAGVRRLLDELAGDLEEALRLVGVGSVGDLSEDLVEPEIPGSTRHLSV